MGLTLLDPYQPGPSPVHRLDARVKLLVALLFIVFFNVTPIQAWSAHLFYLVTMVAITLLARVAPRSVLERAMLAVPFVLMAAIGLPFIQDGEPLLVVRLFSWRVTITDSGTLRFVNVIVKSWLSILVAITLALTTHFLEILRGMRSLGIPTVLIAIVMLMYRYMYVLVDEGMRLIRARDARTAQAEEGKSRRPLLWRAQVTGHMIGTLFLRTYERSERIYGAMLARGFTGEIRMLQPSAVSARDILSGGTCVVILAAVAVLANTC